MNRTGKGTGLGLTISHRIIQQHGGEIEAEGGEDVIPKDIVARKGTEFFDKLIGKDTKKTDMA